MTTIKIDPSIQKLVVDGATSLIADIQNDINMEREISERTYKSCNSILNDATIEYKRIQIAFTEDTKLLVEKALKQQDKRFHKIWTDTLDIYVSECEKITGPILQVMNSVSLESVRLRNKYWWYITGAVAGSTVTTLLVGALFCHFTKAICFTLSAGAIALSVTGICVAVGIVIACIRGVICMDQLYDAYNRCESALKTLLVKYMPKIFGNLKPTITRNDLINALKDALNMFKIKEEIWTDVDRLELLHQQTTRRLNELR